MKKKVAVVLATYNGEKYIAQQLQSIVNQSTAVTYIFVVDDGSKDATIDICLQYKKQYEDINWIVEKNTGEHGTYENFCFGLKLAEGYADYIALCDQDDIWDKKRIQTMLEFFDKYPEMCGLASTFSRFNENGILCTSQRHPHSKKRGIKKITYKEFSHFHEYLGMSMIFKNEVVAEFGKQAGVVCMLHKSHDIFLGFFSILFQGFYYLDQPLTERRSYMGSSSNQLAIKEYNESDYISMKAYSFAVKSQYMNEFSIIAEKYGDYVLSSYFSRMRDLFLVRADYINNRDLLSWISMVRQVLLYDGFTDYFKDVFRMLRK